MCMCAFIYFQLHSTCVYLYVCGNFTYQTFPFGVYRVAVLIVARFFMWLQVKKTRSRHRAQQEKTYLVIDIP